MGGFECLSKANANTEGVKKPAAVYRTDNVSTVDLPRASPPPQLTATTGMPSINAQLGVYGKGQNRTTAWTEQAATQLQTTAAKAGAGRGTGNPWAYSQGRRTIPEASRCFLLGGPATLRAPASFCQMQVYL